MLDGQAAIELEELMENFNAMLYMRRSAGAVFVRVVVQVDQRSLTMRPRGLSRLVAFANGIRSDLTIDRNLIDELVDTETVSNGGTWLRLTTGQCFRLSMMGAHSGLLPAILSLEVSLPADKHSSERELRKSMLASPPLK